MKQIYKSLFKILYLFEINFLKNKMVNFLYLYYDNLSIDLLCLLSLLKQKYFFIKLINITSQKVTNNIEYNVLFNRIKLENSNFCLLINTNLRFENTYFNLQLKQRLLKGNFKLFSICSFVNLTTYINTNILGTGINIIKLIVEGLHPLCQTLIFEKNPNIVINTKLLKLKNNSFLYFMLIYLKKFITYYKLNTLNYSIYESGINLISNFSTYNKMFSNFSSIYLINLQCSVINNIINTNLLYLPLKINTFTTIHINRMCLIQNYIFNAFHINKSMKYMNYFFLPTKTFYQDTGLFFNTEGLIRKNPKLFVNSNIYSHWKLLRMVFNELNIKLKLLEYTANFLIYFNLRTRFNFVKLIFLLYLSKNIINVNFNYMINGINSYFINKINITFSKNIRLINVKMTFLLNDFYLNNKDPFSNNSLILIKLAKITNLQSTNFF